MKQSSIEILVNAIHKRFGIANCGDMEKEIQQAKELHKQEIIDANRDGGIFFTEPSRQERADDYYKNTYEK